MSTKLNPSHTGRPIDNTMYESCGLVIARICPACNLEKKPGQSHPKCSKKLQQMYRAGKLPARKL